ncbi:MAG TPA: hypothetical protein VGL25_13365 [Casimicrobiaceae bacterium]
MSSIKTTFGAVLQWLSALGFALFLTGQASAAFHLFRIDELYSNADGTVQFIELKESTGSDFESFWQGQTLTSTQGTTTRIFTFPANLPSTQTASRSVLIATPAFAALAGVTPDFVVAAPFLFPGGGTINYAGVDSVSYGPLPNDGVTSVNRNGVSAPNSPTNFAGQTGSLAAPAPPPAAATSVIPTLGTAGLSLLAILLTLSAWRAARGDKKQR